MHGLRPVRVGIDDLGEVVVLVDVHAGLAETLVGHAGAAHLAETVDVERVLAEAGLDLGAELVRPGLGAVEADAQRQVFGPQAAVARGVGQVHGVGRRAAQGGGADLPFTTKIDLRDHYPFGMFARPREEIVRVHASSGTTGKPIVVAYTEADLQVWTSVMVRSFAACGLHHGDVVQNAYGYGLFTGGLGAHYGAEALGATRKSASPRGIIGESTSGP